MTRSTGDPRRPPRGPASPRRPPANGRAPQLRPPVQRLELAGVRRSVLVGLALAALVPVVIVLLVVFNVGGSKSPSPARTAGTAGTTGPAKAKASTAALPLTATTIAHDKLAKAVAGINVSVTAKGMLPPSSCKLTNSTTVTCMQPTPAVDIVVFRTYPSVKALYAAYQARVSAIAQAPFRSNFGNCTETMTNGEVGWNHDFQHPSMYPMSEFISGQITDDKAAGRVYCTFEDSDLYLVWTQDDGRILGELSGAPHVDAYVWWRQVHHSVVMPGTPNMMMAMTGPTSTHSSTSTTGMPGTKSMPGTKTMPGTRTMPGNQSMSGTTSTQGMK